MPLVQVKGPNFTAGFEYDSQTEKVINAAPILGWAVGKDKFHIEYWCKKKGFEYAPVKYEELAKEARERAESTEKEIIELLKKGGNIDAIRLVKDRGLSLRDAKLFVEDVIARRFPEGQRNYLRKIRQGEINGTAKNSS